MNCNYFITDAWIVCRFFISLSDYRCWKDTKTSNQRKQLTSIIISNTIVKLCILGKKIEKVKFCKTRHSYIMFYQFFAKVILSNPNFLEIFDIFIAKFSVISIQIEVFIAYSNNKFFRKILLRSSFSSPFGRFVLVAIAGSLSACLRSWFLEILTVHPIFCESRLSSSLNVLGEHYPVGNVQHGEQKGEENSRDAVNVQCSHSRPLGRSGSDGWWWASRWFLRSAG